MSQSILQPAFKFYPGRWKHKLVCSWQLMVYNIIEDLAQQNASFKGVTVNKVPLLLNIFGNKAHTYYASEY